MISSMTGFARREILQEDFTIKMELKSLNHKFLEVNIYFTKELSFLEPDIRKQLSKYFYRGKIDAYASIKSNNSNFLSPKINLALVNEIINNLNTIKFPSDKNIVIDIAQLLTLPGVYILNIDENIIKEKIEPVFMENWNQLVMELINYRKSEGKILYDSINSLLEACDEKIIILERFLANHKKLIENMIKEKIKELNLVDQIDQNRFNEEILYYIIKMDISEEITRLKAHLQRFKEIINNKQQVGKELDFILQEMNREVQTILSKSSLHEVSDTVIELKCDIEKIRQQVQNIE